MKLKRFTSVLSERIDYIPLAEFVFIAWHSLYEISKWFSYASK